MKFICFALEMIKWCKFPFNHCLVVGASSKKIATINIIRESIYTELCGMCVDCTYILYFYKHCFL